MKGCIQDDKTTIYLPWQDTGKSQECLILQGMLKDETEFYTDFTRFEGMISLIY